MNFPQLYEIPVSGKLCGKVTIPGSKSITNRALIIAALASGKSTIRNPLFSVDTQVMKTALESLQISFDESDNQIVLKGCAGRFPVSSVPLYVENSGTSARFLLSALLLGTGEYEVDGNMRMRERPLLPLLEVFRQMNCSFSCLKKENFLPLKITGNGFLGGTVRIHGGISSQYISGLMMSAPYAQNPLKIYIEGDLVSADYVKMTAALMETFGAEIIENSLSQISISNQTHYSGREFSVEADMSSASYFFAMAAISGGEITVESISKNSLQGDIGLLELLEKMGCQVLWSENSVTVQGGHLKGITADMNGMSDVAPTLATVALFAEGETEIRNAENMRVKECDRISAVTAEFRKVGAQITEFQDGWKITGGGNYRTAKLKTYDDHRMAMSFSLIGLKTQGIRILDPVCVTKTFPTYFDLLFTLCKTA